MTLGKRIKAARERLGLTQPKVAAVFNETVQSVSNWERDKNPPDGRKLVKLADVLKVPLRWLLDGKGDPPAPDALEVTFDGLDASERAMFAAMIQAMRKERDRVA